MPLASPPVSPHSSQADYWAYTYEDSVDLIAKLPTLAALIYRHSFKDGKVAAIDPELDWAANFNRMLGFNTADFDDCMRLYLAIHAFVGPLDLSCDMYSPLTCCFLASCLAALFSRRTVTTREAMSAPTPPTLWARLSPTPTCPLLPA